MGEKANKTMVFVETKRKCEDLTRMMKQDGWRAVAIHGDKGQSERDWALREFKNNKCPILVGTDVAARGLHIDDVKFVINFDYPNCSEDYIHRIGRTARAGETGTAYTFFTRKNAKQAKDLVEVLKEARQEVNPSLMQLASASSSYGGGRDRSRWGRSGGSGGRGGGGRGGGGGRSFNSMNSWK